MAEHRWDTAPSASRLTPPWLTSHPPENEHGLDVPGNEGGQTGHEAEDLTQEPEPQGQPRRRWLMSFRAAVLAVCLFVGAAAGLAVFKGTGAGIEVSRVELDAGRAEESAPVQPLNGDAGSPSNGGRAAGSGTLPGAESRAAPRADEADADGTAAGVSSASPSILVIHVAGAVIRPGVVRIPSGSRTGDAVDAAGGAQADADLTAVNLAAPLQDGMMVVVPRIGETAVHPAAGGGAESGADNGSGQGAAGTVGTGGDGSVAGTGTGGLIDINAASLQELEALPRVGPVIAQRIIDWREEHGQFSRPEDLDAVPGIGEAMMAALLPLITV